MAHAFTPLDLPGSSAAGMMLTVTGHTLGWPVAAGGAQSIADALLAELTALGGTVVTGTRVTDLSQVADADAVLLDTSVEDATRILGNRLPNRVARAWRRFRRGPAVAKVDYVIEGGSRGPPPTPGAPAPSISAAPRHRSRTPSGTVGQDGCPHTRSHSSGNRGSPTRPAPSSGTDTRSTRCGAYAHVPAGWDGTPEQTMDLVTTQIEDAAPGFRERVIAAVASPGRHRDVGAEQYRRRHRRRGITSSPTACPTAAAAPLRHRCARRTLCSSSTAPGGGVHFMCGMNAAQRALGRRT